MNEPRRRLAAIMFTDVVGYSALAQENEAAALALLDRHNRLLRPIFPRFGGREVKTIGDAFLVEFESALDAAQCALEIQQTLHDFNASPTEGRKIAVRVGIHVGDVVQTEDDVLGDAVNIASRIEPLAEPEGICLSQQVYDQVRNKVSTPIVQLPPVALKNIHIPTTVYRFVQPWEGSVRGRIASEPSGRNLAVLPLSNISPDPHDEYFADGLTEELISALSQVRNLSVIARTSVMPYKSASKSIAQVGAELGVDTVLEGSVRKAGNRIRISLQLVDVATQRHVWASSYNRELDDVFAVQTDIADRTADALRLELSLPGGSGARRRPTANPVAYDLYLRGLAAWPEHDRVSLEEAVGYFERAVKLDPTFAEAYAAWGNLYVRAAGDSIPMRDVMPRARELAARALELDPDSSGAHATLANIALQFDNDWKLAEAEFVKAISLNPSNANAFRFYGLLLMALDRFDEAKDVFRQATRLDPTGMFSQSLAWAELEAGNFDEALRLAEEDLRKHPDSVVDHLNVGMFSLAAGRDDAALKVADAPLTASTEDETFDLALLRALVGRPAGARDLLAKVDRGEWRAYLSRTYLAMLYAVLGETTRSLDLLERDYQEGDRLLWLTFRGIYFDPIRNDPRFVSLLQRYGLTVLPLHRRLRQFGSAHA